MSRSAPWELSYRGNSYVRKFGALIQARNFPLRGAVNSGAAFGDKLANNGDPRVGNGAAIAALTGWDVTDSGNPVPGGVALRCQSGTTPMPYVFDEPFDTVDVYYTQLNGGGTFDCNVDGGASLGQTNTGSPATSGYVKKTFTGITLGTHTFNIVRVSGTIRIDGVIPRNSTRREILNLNLGCGGWKTSDYANVSQPWSPANALATIAPTLTTINLGINDMAQGIAVSAAKANLQTLITKALISGEVMLFVPHWIALTGGANLFADQATQDAYGAMYYELADTNDIPLLDFHKLYVSRANMEAMGYNYDTLHGTYFEAQHKASVMASAIESVW